jgi:Flp pilus assembly pilin Flp
MRAIRRYLEGESGAVTVDWVVLTAATVALGLAVMTVVSGGIEDLATDISDFLEDAPTPTTFEEWQQYRAGQGSAGGEESEG